MNEPTSVNLHLSLDISNISSWNKDAHSTNNRMDSSCYIPHLSFSSGSGYHGSLGAPVPDPPTSQQSHEALWRPSSPAGLRSGARSSSDGAPSSPPHSGAMRACLDMEMSGTFPLPTSNPSESEPISNIFAIPPTSAPPPHYKEISLAKDKEGGHGVADALLSLKHAVVHPSQAPLSPGAFGHHFPQSTAHNGFYGCQTAAPHNHLGGYSSTCGQYGYSDQMPPQTSPSHGQTPSNMFPSMSVNVSMSMNVGMPLNGNLPIEQWSSHHHPAPMPPAPQQYSPSLQPQQYSPPSYNMQNQAYTSSYSFSADLRSPAFSACKDMIYKSQEYKPKFYNFGPLNMRRKPPTSVRPGVENGKVNLCRICGKTYARPSTLKTHMRTHSGEKPYRCSTCTKSFSQAANLTAHIRTHSGEKPFRCMVCERRFSQSSSVTTHMRTHSGERPYRCRACKKAFSDSSTLTKHLRIHSGEKPYQCKLCLLRFSQSGNLNRHMRVHANNA